MDEFCEKLGIACNFGPAERYRLEVCMGLGLEIRDDFFKRLGRAGTCKVIFSKKEMRFPKPGRTTKKGR